MVAIPLSKEACEISINETVYPNCAKTCAIPFPIVPEPITAIFFIVILFRSLFI